MKKHMGIKNSDSKRRSTRYRKKKLIRTELAKAVKAVNNSSIPADEIITAGELEVLVIMPIEEAEICLKKLNDGNCDARQVLKKMREGNAHKSFGYDKWEDFCKARLSHLGTPGNIRRLNRASDVEVRLGLPIGTLAISTTTELFPLLDTDLNAAWKKAREIHVGDGYPTADEINAAIEEVKMFDKVMKFIKRDATISQQKEIAYAVIDGAPVKGLKRMRKRIKERLQQGDLDDAANDEHAANKPVKLINVNCSSNDELHSGGVFKRHSTSRKPKNNPHK